MRILDEAGTDPRGAEAAVAGLFEARYPELVRLAGLLGADDPEDIAQEAFARLLRHYGTLRDADAALGYVRATVCNLARNRRRHLRVVRLRTPAERLADAESSEQAAVAREEQRAAIAALPPTTCPGAAYGGVCQQARIRQVMDGIKVWTYVGFTDPEPVQANHAKPTLCEVTGLVGAEADYVGVYTNAGQVARRIFVLNPTQTVSGVALPSVTSVTAELADGRKYTGTFVTNKLFTYPVWLVSYPLKDPATLVFRDAAGKQVAVLHEPANP